MTTYQNLKKRKEFYSRIKIKVLRTNILHGDHSLGFIEAANRWL